MAIVKAFQAIRPIPELADRVAALPYDVMDSKEARELVKDNPYSFLHVDKAEIDLDPSIHIYDPKVYEKARDNMKQMIADGTFTQDREDALYIYRLVMDGRAQTGIVGCTSIDEYIDDKIKKHEKTRADKEKDRINHVDYCNANTGPIFLTYRAQPNISQTMTDWVASHQPIYDFVSEDGVGHTIWIIDDKTTIDELVTAFQKVDSLYIADGHHRNASAVKVGLMRREQFPAYSGAEEFNFYLSVIFPDEQLYIMDYNRVVKDLNGDSIAEFIEKVEEKFEVEIYRGQGQIKPVDKHTFGMYLDGKWYRLKAKAGTFDASDPVDRLDVSILQNNLLHPILDIQDPRTSNRIDFIGGIRGLEELERRVNKDMKVAFSLYPTTIDDLMAIADEGKIMPPKSTWFEPKLRSGLFIHDLGEK